MAWIELHQELRNHPKLLGASIELKVTPQTMLGHLLFLWWWAVDYASDGVIQSVDGASTQLISNVSDWKNDPKTFVDVLIKYRWLDVTDEGLEIHDWLQYCGMLVRRRLINKAKKLKMESRIKSTIRRHRVNVMSTRRRQNVALPNSTVPYPTEPNQTQPDRTEESLAPPNEVDDVFIAYCESWGRNPKVYKLTPKRKKWIEMAIKQYGKDGALLGVQNFRMDDYEERPKFNDLEYLFGGTEDKRQKRVDKYCQQRLINNSQAFQKTITRRQEVQDTIDIAKEIARRA